MQTFGSKFVNQAVVCKKYDIKCLHLHSVIHEVKLKAYQEIVTAETTNATVCLLVHSALSCCEGTIRSTKEGISHLQYKTRVSCHFRNSHPTKLSRTSEPS